MRFDNSGYCPFWTTDDWAAGYCRFDGEDCHSSFGMSYRKCKKYQSLCKTSIKFKITAKKLCFVRDGKGCCSRAREELLEAERIIE